MEPPTDPGRHLLDDLRDIEGVGSGRLRLELLDHLVVVALDGGRSLPRHLVFTALHFGTPGAARLITHVAEAFDPSERAQEAERWLAQAATAGETARASVVVAVAPYLKDQEDAYVTAMGLSSEPLWVAGLLALGRTVEARSAARGDLLARVRAVTSELDVIVPAASPDPWWRAIRFAASGGAQDVEDHAAAVAALVAIPDGAWHLLAIRARAQLRPVIDDAVRSGQAYLASLRQSSPDAPVERHARLLGLLDADARSAVAEELTHVLMEMAGIGAPPSGDARPDAGAPPASGGSVSSAPPPGSLRPRTESPPGESAPRGPPPRRRRGIAGLIKRKAASRQSRELDEPRPAGKHNTALETAGSSESSRPAVVSTGFADARDPGAALDPYRALRRSKSYVFWLQVAPEPVAGSIEDEHVALPPDLPERARLTVVLFAFDGELGLLAGATTGVIELVGDGTAIVVEQSGHGVTLEGERRLRFSVTTPDGPGPARLRCSIYHSGVLVQSRVVTAHVDDPNSPPVTPPSAAASAAPALRSVVDYRLFRALEPRSLAALSEHRASLLLNDDGAGTHGLRFAAVDGGEVITRDVSIGEGAIADQIRMARSALRRVSWGDEEEWTTGNMYRYGGDLDEARLTADLVALAANGARFFQLLVEEVAGNDPDVPDPDPYLARDRISEVLRRPGRVQIALQRSPSHILPAALVYDHWLTDSAAVEDYRLCPEFADALRSQTRLEESSCLQGGCPQARHGADPTVVCPSGFWGFRHELGFPVTAAAHTDATELIAVADAPAVSVAVSTELTSHAAHVRALQGIVGDDDRVWRFADTRDEFLAGLRSDDRQVIYLYCHGGVTNNVPYVRLGEEGARPITRLDLANERVRWQVTRPLVILNGCHTTALDPETAIDFVRFFVRTALASGVIGTEITVFEELGQVFGQAFLQRFLSPGTSVGAAVRGARLDLLATGNPLGLVYIPFALAGLRLAATPGTTVQGGGS